MSDTSPINKSFSALVLSSIQQYNYDNNIIGFLCGYIFVAVLHTKQYIEITIPYY